MPGMIPAGKGISVSCLGNAMSPQPSVLPGQPDWECLMNVPPGRVKRKTMAKIQKELTGARFERAPLTRTEYTLVRREENLESAALDHSAIQPLVNEHLATWLQEPRHGGPSVAGHSPPSVSNHDWFAPTSKLILEGQQLAQDEGFINGPVGASIQNDPAMICPHARASCATLPRVRLLSVGLFLGLGLCRMCARHDSRCSPACCG